MSRSRNKHRERGAPRQQQRSEVLRPRQPEPARARGEQFLLVGEVGRQEDDDEDLAELRRLERERSDLGPEPGPVDLAADAGHDRQQQQHDTGEPERVRVRVELTVVADEPEREAERRETDQQPYRLLPSDRRFPARDHDAVEHRDAEPRERCGGREQHRVGSRGGPPHHQPPCHEGRASTRP